MLKLIIEGNKMRKPAEADKEAQKAKAAKPSNKAGKAANK